MKKDVEDSSDMSGKATEPLDSKSEQRPVPMAMEPGATSESESQRPLPGAASEMIGRRLRQAYETQLKEPIPDRFAALLDDLAKGESA